MIDNNDNEEDLRMKKDLAGVYGTGVDDNNNVIKIKKELELDYKIDGEEQTKNPIQFCIDVILKEARQEETLVKQLVYTMLSAYTNNPINLPVNSPSGEGKNYVINKVGDNFPKEDVTFLAGMTDKALFHRHGTLVIKNGVGEYESVDNKIAEIDSEIADKESEIATSNDKNFKQARRNQIKQLEQQKKDLFKNAKKIDRLIS
jgi:hypothetical protein